ncbi:hypothetical protein [Rhizobium sp. EC-SD404]|uniref:hypothetical protein n=1 Tax=Rhizobium sp. EC-SD404 TaxID=2038389 RepID=UPI00125F399A|nr:hypothetical protein [Rhizobium sp. EC-SD404]
MALHLAMIKGNGEFIVRAPVGYDDQTGLVYSTFVAIAPMAAYTDTKYDLSFALIEASTDGSHVEDKRDGLATRPVISSNDERSLIRAVICASVSQIIDEAKPSVVSMMTHSSGLPAKALRKFDEIARVFAQQGYRSGRADPWSGHHIWMMERRHPAEQIQPIEVEL